MTDCEHEVLLNRLFKQLGYNVNDRALLKQALTHRSFDSNKHNERLEFVGDAVLGMVIADLLFRRFSKVDEGKLTRFRARLVNKEALASLAREINLGACLFLGHGELKNGGRDNTSILADAMESLIAVIYLDAGLDAVTDVITKLWSARIHNLTAEQPTKDNKTRLQEWLQQRGFALPTYEVAEILGKEHSQVFVVHCRTEVNQIITTGRGASRKSAEQEAAKAAFEQLNGLLEK